MRYHVSHVRAQAYIYIYIYIYIFSYKNIKISITFRMIISGAYCIRTERNEKHIFIARLLYVLAFVFVYVTINSMKNIHVAER